MDARVHSMEHSPSADDIYLYFALPIPTVVQGSSLIGTVLLYFLSAAVIHGNDIQEETVVVMPTLGVQLETCYKR